MSRVPSAPWAMLRKRAALARRARDFFAARGVLEVETPMLSRAGNTDPAIASVAAHVDILGADTHYLHTSPEFAMKKLLAAGSGDIFQLCRVFRDEELGPWHEPEFTLLEWYRVGWTEHALMAEVELLCHELAGPAIAPGAAVHITYAKAFEDALDADPHGDVGTLADRLGQRNIDVPAGLGRDALLDLALCTVVAPSFDPQTLVFLYDYPENQAALARVRHQTPPVAERFEVFLGGIELGNGFHELTDPDEQLARFERDNEVRAERGLAAMPIDYELIAALESGLPDCAGVAMGFDRLVALATGSESVAETLAFTHRQRAPAGR